MLKKRQEKSNQQRHPVMVLKKKKNAFAKKTPSREYLHSSYNEWNFFKLTDKCKRT